MALTTASFDITPKVGADYRVQGISASFNEYNVSLDLDKLKINYTFQYAVNGGRAFIGGFIIDYVAWVVPAPVPIWIDEEHWHSGEAKQRDLWQRAQLSHLTYEQFAPYIALTGDETDAEGKSLPILRRRLL